MLEAWCKVLKPFRQTYSADPLGEPAHISGTSIYICAFMILNHLPLFGFKLHREFIDFLLNIFGHSKPGVILCFFARPGK